MEGTVGDIHMAVGSMHLRRVGRFRFPTVELVGADGPIAELGRDGSVRTFFGPGRRVRLNDGTAWRIKATTSTKFIVPVIMSDKGKIALSGPLHAKRCYGITGRDWGYRLIALGSTGILDNQTWSLRRHETEVATTTASELVADGNEPIPIAAALMAFTLITHGIPGERELVPKSD